MKILGLSAFYHDSAAALIDDGKILAAAQEERFTRKKNDASFPSNAIACCLKEAGVTFDQIDYVAFYEKPFLKFERLLETYLAFAPRGFSSFAKAMPVWLKEKLYQKRLLVKELRKSYPNFDWNKKLLFSEHHLSHAGSAFFPSPFSEAVILTLDGVGEWTTSSLAIGKNNQIKMHEEIRFPNSLGLLYSAFTYYTGFKVNSGEYKVMGLAPYGEPKYRETILKHLMDLKEDGSFRLNQEYFDYCTGIKMINRKFEDLFHGPARLAHEPIRKKDMDLAASIQSVTEEVMLRLCRTAAKETGIRNLCLAGGVALNCVANGKILKEKIFDNVWVQPASGDAGGSLGAALSAYYLFCNQPREIDPEDSMSGSYLGNSFSEPEIETQLRNAGAVFSKLSEHEMISACTNALAQGKALGWFQGKMEFGPRALGSRSILADARSETMQSVLNLKVKRRESFRPFAPAILSEDASKWFDISEKSPYMVFVANVLEEHRVPKLSVPAVTHVDYSARIQTVHQKTNPIFHKLLSQFKNETQCPLLVNTSFNVRGEPIVQSPADAFRCFMGTEIDVLAVGNFVLRKEDQRLLY